MKLTEPEMRMAYQLESTSQAGVLNELYMTCRYSRDEDTKATAESLMAKIRPLSDKECMALVNDVQKNYHLPGKARTIGEMLAEARQKSGAEKLAGHDIMALERFDPDTRHMIVFDVLSHESPMGFKGERMRLFLTEAVRLSPEADLSGKLLNLGSGFSQAMESIAPSFHPADLLVGLIGAVIIRLIIYTKGKNAKKYRKGMEYGSARWGTPEDIKPYIDPVFENNVLLTQTERLMMSNRPKNPKYARNKNILVIGGSGSGKTRFFVKPNLMQLHSSYVVTDPKGLIC